MLNPPSLKDLDVKGKRVIVRGDLDVSDPEKGDFRLESLLPTLKYLLENNAKVILIGHRGRPEGKIDEKYSLKPVSEALSRTLGSQIKFVNDIVGAEAKKESESLGEGEIMCLENLRFDSREESNDEAFSKSLADLGDIYVNEAFSVSHREHSSIVGLPKILPHAAGFRLLEEVENLSKVFENPKKPLVFLISGVKEDKLKYVEEVKELADKVLVGGRLPDYLEDKALESVRLQKGKVIVGNLVMDKEDITINTIDVFSKEVKKAGTIVVSGPLGKYEDDGHKQGTENVLKAVTENSNAFKIAGGGDTIDALAKFSLSDKFDWISVGGGAMLEFLSKKTLPGIEELTK